MKTAISWILQLLIIGALGFGAVKFLKKTDDADSAPEQAISVDEATLNLPIEVLTPLSVTPEYTSLAKVEEWQSSNLATTAAGRVIWVCDCFEEGLHVTAGTRLLQIDPISYNRDVVDREKDLVNARAKLTQAEAETQQARENYARLDLGEPSDIALKLPELEAATLVVTSAEAALAIARDKLSETNIVAPYTGIISKVGATTGDLISNGSNLGTLIGTDVFKVRFPILDSQLSLAKVGAEILVETTTQPMITKTGIIKAIDIGIDQSTRLNTVIVAIQTPTKGEVLRIGRFVNGTFAGTPVVNVFAVPLISLDNEMHFFQIGTDNRLIRTSVQPVYRDLNAVYIDAGSQSELRIVTGNALGLRDGMMAQGYEQ